MEFGPGAPKAEIGRSWLRDADGSDYPKYRAGRDVYMTQHRIGTEMKVLAEFPSFDAK